MSGNSFLWGGAYTKIVKRIPMRGGKHRTVRLSVRKHRGGLKEKIQGRGRGNENLIR